MLSFSLDLKPPLNKTLFFESVGLVLVKKFQRMERLDYAQQCQMEHGFGLSEN
jgi:hypothetical protein